MPINVKSFSELTRKDVFTAKGAYCGKITDVEVDLEKFRVKSLVVDAVHGSYLSNLVGNKKGVVVPFSMVQSVGDIVLIKHVHPTVEDQEQPEEKPTAKYV